MKKIDTFTNTFACMKRVELTIIGLSYSQMQSGAYTLILSEEEGNRTLPIIIGSFEAQAIAIELEQIVPHRPLTHDLFKKFANIFDVHVREIRIFHLENGIFYSQIVCQQNGTDYYIEARTSDAIAIGIRFDAPIYTTEEILEQAGILIDEHIVAHTDAQQQTTHHASYSTASIEDLERRLKEAIENEEYESASMIRDEMKKRNKNETKKNN